MRTTVNIDDDLLCAAKEMAQSQKISVGEVISNLIRRGLAPVKSPRTRNGIPLFERGPNAQVVTTELVNRLLDEELS